jgi:protein-tyrosine phosphatase
LGYSRFGDTSILTRHPHDPDVLIGGIGAVREPPAEVDAVVSLCRLGAAEVPAPGVRHGDHIEVWLTDSADPADNPNLALVLLEAANTVAALRGEGRTVLLHCVQALSRTPSVAALYAARHRGVPLQEALADIRQALPYTNLNPAFLAALRSLDVGG